MTHCSDLILKKYRTLDWLWPFFKFMNFLDFMAATIFSKWPWRTYNSTNLKNGHSNSKGLYFYYIVLKFEQSGIGVIRGLIIIIWVILPPLTLFPQLNGSIWWARITPRHPLLVYICQNYYWIYGLQKSWYPNVNVHYTLIA